jgi:hypothetical protein
MIKRDIRIKGLTKAIVALISWGQYVPLLTPVYKLILNEP